MKAAWKPVSVGLNDENVDADENDNHYDNPKLQRTGPSKKARKRPAPAVRGSKEPYAAAFQTII
jgi:hypothetical protein